MTNDSKLTTEEAVAALDALTDGDPEGTHIEADKILLAAASKSVREAYEQVKERVEGFWYA